MSPKNQAAWIVAKSSAPLKVGDASYTSPGPGQVTIKTGAVAINPFDWVLQYQGGMLASHLKYPMVLGVDVAGTIVEVGPKVTRFKVGDRVAGNACSIGKEINNPAEGAFQLYVVLRENMVVGVPDTITTEQSAVLGPGVTTAAYSLFHKDYLALDMPQAAHLAWADVLFNLQWRLDMMSSRLALLSLVSDLVRALEGYELCGAYTVGVGADKACVSVITNRLAQAPELPTKKFITFAGGGSIAADSIKGFLGSYRMMSGMMGMMGRNAIKRMTSGIEIKFIMMANIAEPNNCVSRVYMNFLGPAIAGGQFIPSPEAQIVGRGLDKINEALELNQKGVSGKKLVVSLP